MFWQVDSGHSWHWTYVHVYPLITYVLWSNPRSWGQMVTADSGALTLLLHITKDCHHITKDCHPSTHQHMPRVQQWTPLHTQSWDITILLCNVKIGSVVQPWDCANSPTCVETPKEWYVSAEMITLYRRDWLISACAYHMQQQENLCLCKYVLNSNTCLFFCNVSRSWWADKSAVSAQNCCAMSPYLQQNMVPYCVLVVRFFNLYVRRDDHSAVYLLNGW